MTSPVLHDPGITIGGRRVLVRTDGLWIVFDASKPLGKMDVFVGSKEGAIGEAERLKLADECALP